MATLTCNGVWERSLLPRVTRRRDIERQSAIFATDADLLRQLMSPSEP